LPAGLSWPAQRDQLISSHRSLASSVRVPGLEGLTLFNPKIGSISLYMLAACQSEEKIREDLKCEKEKKFVKKTIQLCCLCRKVI
jgi:hypothetical protein